LVWSIVIGLVDESARDEDVLLDAGLEEETRRCGDSIELNPETPERYRGIRRNGSANQDRCLPLCLLFGFFSE